MEPSENSAENSHDLSFEAEIPEGWYMYSSDFSEEVGPLVTEFSFVPSEDYETRGDIVPQGRKKRYDELWEGEYTFFTGTASFRQEVLVKGEDPIFEGSISYQICSDETGQCIPYETHFRFEATGKSLLDKEKPGGASLFTNSYGGAESGGGIWQVPSGGDKQVAGEKGSEIPVVEMEPFENRSWRNRKNRRKAGPGC